MKGEDYWCEKAKEIEFENEANKQTIERLREGISELKKIDEYGKDRGAFFVQIKRLYELLNTTEPEQNYYCSEEYKNGFYCEEQCERCKKADDTTEPTNK